MTTPDASQPIDLSQIKTAAQDAAPEQAPPRELRVHGRTWPLVAKMSLFSQASLQAALNNNDLFGIVDGLASMVPAEHRDEVSEYLLEDRPADHPEFVDDEVLIEVFKAAQEAFRG